MADVNSQIIAALGRFAGGIVSLDEEKNHCLGFVTSVIENATGISIPEFYATYVRDHADPQEHWAEDGPWARDAEHALRALRMSISPKDAKPGDLFFIWRDAEAHAWSERMGHTVYYGHVAIMLAPGFLIENVDPKYRPHSFHRGNIQITSVHHWFTPSTVIRFDPDKKPGGG